jgi:hypothetical protein
MGCSYLEHQLIGGGNGAMGLLGTPKYPPLNAPCELPWAPQVPPRPVERACGTRRLGPPGGELTPQTPRPLRGHNVGSRHPRGCPPAASHGVLVVGGGPCGGLGRPGGPKPFPRRISTLSCKLTSQSPRADTQSKINAASRLIINQRSLSCCVYLTAVRGALAASLAVPEHELRCAYKRWC